MHSETAVRRQLGKDRLMRRTRGVFACAGVGIYSSTAQDVLSFSLSLSFVVSRHLLIPFVSPSHTTFAKTFPPSIYLLGLM